ALTRPSAVLDETHPGDIEGALGRIRAGEEYSSTWRRRLVTFLAIVGPGLIVMVGDNDAGGVSTYSQAGQNYGYSLLWGWFSVGDLFLLNFLTIATEFIGVSLALSYFGVSKYIAVPVAAAVLV